MNLVMTSPWFPNVTQRNLAGQVRGSHTKMATSAGVIVTPTDYSGFAHDDGQYYSITFGRR